ncbi:hypothetical protein [Acinetobacter pittii]|uniref:hypothetical protein n=1 Tax=Acinetobacter pittii TaxID=48296 RepID=UPI001F3EE20D|nr:hypothetical protein [Acinetobacter pittii]MCE6238360.1 hypothetical protein [Acinetobacter pittii]MCE6689621.1 hypothetical protein [Acinetobacter pittii]MCE6697887.1 hypothetical protein [Acinetobacter pittii]
MKHPLDNQTVDWCESSVNKTMSAMFDSLVTFMIVVTKETGRKSSQDYERITGVSKRCAQRQLNALVKSGYLISDGSIPRGYMATDKAKQIFGSAT